jgi:hypothetical protein
MKKIHVWFGKFKTEKELKRYLDQNDYLEAWSVYDNEPPTGNAEDDKEPNPELRCDFCKEVHLDNYDEDLMIMKYYKNSLDIKTIANDIGVDKNELETLLRGHSFIDFNSVVAIEVNDLDEKDASRSETIKYIGKLAQFSDQSLSDYEVHYLWIGDHRIDKKNILQQAALNKKDIIKLNYHHTSKSEKLDEILILQIEDYNIAEKMILKVEELRMMMAHSMLQLVVKSTIEIHGEKIADMLGMKYIGKFDKE